MRSDGQTDRHDEANRSLFAILRKLVKTKYFAARRVTAFRTRVK